MYWNMGKSCTGIIGCRLIETWDVLKCREHVSDDTLGND